MNKISQVRTASRQRRSVKTVLVRSHGIATVNKIAFLALLFAICVAVLATSWPELKKLRKSQKEFVKINQEATRIAEEKDRCRRELFALRNYPEYLEIIARDRLDLSKPGEHVFRINRLRQNHSHNGNATPPKKSSVPK